MSSVVVERAHSLSADELRKALVPFEDEIRSKYGLQMDWRGSVALMKGTGASGQIDLLPASVKVTVKLGMIARAAGIKPERVKASIEKRLDAALAAADQS